MRCLALVALALAAATSRAATAYVSDELILGVYPQQNQQGERLTTLHSGAALETLSVSGEYTQVRLGDGRTGWVKTSYLTTQEPATVRLKKAQDELDRLHATNPGLAEAAAHSEVERLQGELQAKQSELDAVRAAPPGPTAEPGAPSAPPPAPRGPSWKFTVGALLAGAVGGFWLGYATLARRIKSKFGGLRVY